MHDLEKAPISQFDNINEAESFRLMSDESIKLKDMTKRLHVLFDDEEYRALQQSAREDRMAVAEWVRQALREVRVRRRQAADAKLEAVAKACSHELPTADMQSMLKEIEEGHRTRTKL